MKKTILIFGAGLNQLTLIKSSRELGLTSIVLDPFYDAPGKNIADYFYKVEGNDYETTKKILLKHEVKGIVTSQMEKPMRLMAKLAKEFNLIFHSSEVVEKSLDKWLMKKAFLENNVPCANGILVDVENAIIFDKVKNFSFPLIIKPKAATSSQGVYKVRDFDELNNFVKITKKFSQNGEVIIEEFLDGPELSVEAITFKGKTTIVQFTEKFVTPFPRTVEMGHLQPALLSEQQKKDVAKIVISAINAIGIDNSASHSEVKLTKQGPKMVEIGARLGGDYISSYLTLFSNGVDMDKAAIQVSLGVEPELNPILNQFSYIKYFELPEGKRVKKIEGWDDVLKNENVVFANVSVKEGDIIGEITESKKRPGFVIVKGKNRAAVLKDAEIHIDTLKQKIILGDL